MSERTSRPLPGNGYLAHSESDPFFWMTLRRDNIYLSEQYCLWYDAGLSASRQDELIDPPEDLEMAVYTFNLPRDGFVEVLRYDHTDDHPHLDVYWRGWGDSPDAHFTLLLLLAFLGEREGAGIDVRHMKDERGEDVFSLGIHYCAAHDPRLRHLVRQDDAELRR